MAGVSDNHPDLCPKCNAAPWESCNRHPALLCTRTQKSMQTILRFHSTKTYAHSVGLSACFRQWRATQSHCQYLHGYALSVKVEFEAIALDEKNWAVNFGGLKPFKAWLEETFDHKTLVAKDDPQIHVFRSLHTFGMIQLVEVESTGCEKFAEMCYRWLDKWIVDQPEYVGRVTVKRVTVSEHEGNSAYVEALN